MKKIVSVLLVLCMVLSLAACGGKKNEAAEAPAMKVEGTMEELLNKTIEQRPVEFMGGVIPVDLTDLWEGRINTIRLDLTLSDEATREFDILFAGMFRTVEEGIAYANGYMENLGVGAAPTEEETTEAPTEPTDEETTAAPADGETTAAPADGETTAATNDTTAPTEEKGCGAVVGFGAVAVLAAAAAAVALKKKD